MGKLVIEEMEVHGIKTGIDARVNDYPTGGMFLGFKCRRCGKEFGQNLDNGWHWWNNNSKQAVLFHYEHCQGG